MRDELTRAHAIIRVRSDSDAALGWYECDPAGHNVWSNRTLTAWLRCGRSDLAGWAWMNFVHPDDRTRVRAEWERALRDRTSLYLRMRMGPMSGDAWIHYECSVEPIPSIPPPKQPLAWSGWIRPIDDVTRPVITRAFPEA
jgi:hypothetical protein